jgi:diaminopimelate epimerase
MKEGRLDKERETRVSLPYGQLFIRRSESGEIFMRGPAERVCSGTYLIEPPGE